MPFYKVPKLDPPQSRGPGVPTTSAAIRQTPDTTPGLTQGSWDQDPTRTSFSELTEADRDTELERRGHLEQKLGVLNIQSEMNGSSTQVNGKIRRAGLEGLDSLSDRDSDYHRTASPAGSNWSVDSAATGSTGSAGGRGEVRYAHPGESLIARELREQQEREQELRGRWKDMGLDVPDTSSVGETPFTVPQPLQDTYPQRTVSELDISEGTCSDSGIMESEKSPTSTSTAPVYKQRVQPIGEPEGEDEGRSPYIPTDETPIEREIRLSRQREHELRQERGLPPPRIEDRTVLGHDVVDNRYSPASPEPGARREGGMNVTGTLKKLANSRLQMELNREKQREVELKTEGVIQSISEDRRGDGGKYVDVINRRQEEINQENLTTMTLKSKKTSVSSAADVDRGLNSKIGMNSETVVQQQLYTQGASQPKDGHSVPGSRSDHQGVSSPRDGQGLPSSDAQNLSRPKHGHSVPGSRSDMQSIPPPRDPHNVPGSRSDAGQGVPGVAGRIGVTGEGEGRRFEVKHSKQSIMAEEGGVSSRSQAEQRIQQELNELLMREHELRQRQAINSTSSNGH